MHKSGRKARRLNCGKCGRCGCRADCIADEICVKRLIAIYQRNSPRCLVVYRGKRTDRDHKT